MHNAEANDESSAQPASDNSVQNQPPQPEPADVPQHHVAETINNVRSSQLQPEQVAHQQSAADSQAPPAVCILHGVLENMSPCIFL